MRKLLFAALLIAGSVAIAPSPVANAGPCDPTGDWQACIACQHAHVADGGHGIWEACGGTYHDPHQEFNCRQYGGAAYVACCHDRQLAGQPPC